MWDSCFSAYVPVHFIGGGDGSCGGGEGERGEGRGKWLVRCEVPATEQMRDTQKYGVYNVGFHVSARVAFHWWWWLWWW